MIQLLQITHSALMQLKRTIYASGLTLLTTTLIPLTVHAGVFNLTLYNTEPLIDEDSFFLEGGQSSGDFVQLILAGLNNTDDIPDSFGLPGNDDVLLGQFYVGAGTIGPDSDGLFIASNLVLDDSRIGSTAFIRFWNALIPQTATHYGDSALFAIPTPDAFGEALFDTVPLASSPRITDMPFSAVSSEVPEPSSSVLMIFATGLIFLWRRFMPAQYKT